MNQFSVITSFLQKQSASGYKSTVLAPLGWLMGILISALIAFVFIKAPFWIILFGSILVGVTLLVFLVAFIFCLFKDRDALRSEKFSIQKMAIEKGIIGDSLSGEINSNGITKLLDEDQKSDDNAGK